MTRPADPSTGRTQPSGKPPARHVTANIRHKPADPQTTRVVDPAARIRAVRQADGSVNVSGLDDAEKNMFLAVFRALSPVISEQVDAALRTNLEAFAVQARSIAEQTAREVCDHQIVARVKRVERNSAGDIISVIEEPRR